MSRQLIFYATKEDLSAIFTWLIDKKIQILNNKIINDQRIIENKEIFQKQQIVYLTLPDLKVEFKYIEKFDYFYPSSVESEIIDFSFPIISEIDKTLQPGRFYMKKSFYVNNSLQEKSQEFISFYDSLVKYFKKEFLKKYDGVFFNYATDNAIKLLNNGYKERQFI
jgi:hypothetical protein